MNQRWIYVALAAAAALLSLSGCAGSISGFGGAAPERAAEGGADVPRISIMANLHTPEVPSALIETMLEEATGVELTFQWTPDGSYEEKFNASMATGTMPDAVYLKNASMLTFLREPMQSGLFWEIGPYLEEFPNLGRLQTEVLRNTAVEGKVYGLYQERPLSRQGVIFRKDWADRLGLQAPATIDELYTMLYQFTYRDPDGNGVDDTIGLTDRSDLVYGAFKTVLSYFGAPNGWGEKDGRLVPEFMFPEYRETMLFFRKLHEEGLINRDFPVTAKADQQELLTMGKAGVYIGAMGDVHSLQTKAAQSNPYAVLDVHNRVAGPKGERVWATPGFGTVVLFPKSAVRTEEELRQVLGFFDELMTPELANLLHWGVEGVHYTVENGKAVPSDDFDLKYKDVKPYQGIEIGGPNTIDGFLESDFRMPVKGKADRLTKENDSMLVLDPTTGLHSRTFDERGMRLQEIVRDATYHFILGMIDEAGFEAEVQRWLQEGGERIIEEFNDTDGM
ncbi:extracellular solute-binding protein [Paenibacillus antri]|uniref:Extracellular solute-binding protein n=1 Tax=Paenibacillus antri TaxID=2582848 RepID=A0A5R9FYV0_9BACL|nr:extracellular solute-binding protein [Paenibacillus antri]TLS49222.1 extracellular solute-binding protein [Paenibacillus antri]